MGNMSKCPNVCWSLWECFRRKYICKSSSSSGLTRWGKVTWNALWWASVFFLFGGLKRQSTRVYIHVYTYIHTYMYVFQCCSIDIYMYINYIHTTHKSHLPSGPRLSLWNCSSYFNWIEILKSPAGTLKLNSCLPFGWWPKRLEDWNFVRSFFKGHGPHHCSHANFRLQTTTTTAKLAWKHLRFAVGITWMLHWCLPTRCGWIPTLSHNWTSAAWWDVHFDGRWEDCWHGDFQCLLLSSCLILIIIF